MPSDLQQAMQIALDHHQLGRLAEAEAIYRQVLGQESNHPDALHLLGTLLGQIGRLDEGIDLIRRAIATNPTAATYYSNLGELLRRSGRFDESITACQRAKELNPVLFDIHYNLGMVLLDRGQLDEAMAAFHQAIALKPDLAGAQNNLGNVLKDKGQLDEAIAAYRQAIALKPGDSETHSNLIIALHNHSGYDVQTLAEEHRRWNRQHAEPSKKFIRPHPNNRDPDRRLRIGYVSPDFREQVVGRFLLPLLTDHDKRQVEVFAYAQVPAPDAMTERLRSCVDGWRSTVGLSDAQAAELIRQDQIDILVDLTMHMANNRLLVFARKPAPVQATYLSYCSSTGLETMDYRLSDPYLDPPGEDETCYSERTIRLPETYWCYHPSIATPEVGPLPAAQQGVITFGCLNNFCKVGEPVLAVWARLLRGIANSQLLLHAKEGSHRRRVLDRLEREGIEPKRVRFVSSVPTPDYFQLYHGIDIALDPFPYNGGTTTCDALWMGVPVVSLAGKTAVGRGGLSILSNVGLPELVARSEEEYVGIASELANDLPRLKSLRSTLRTRMQRSPLMDAPRFVRNLEAAYRQMWRAWCKEQPKMTLNPRLSIRAALEDHRAGRLAEAEAIYRNILSQDPNHADALHLLGVIAHQVGQDDDSVVLIGRSIAFNPNFPEAHYNLGIVLSDKGQTDESIAAYRRAIALNPDFPEAHCNLGNALREKGQLDEAITAYRQAILLNPSYAEAQNNLGVALKDHGQPDEAIAAYRQAIALRPAYSDAYSNLGDALTEKGELDAAIAALLQAIALQPDSAGAHNNLGHALADKREFDPAIAAFHRAIALRPDFAEAHSNLGNTLTDKKEYDAAIAEYRQAIALKPNYAAVYSNLGNTLKEKGQLDEAIASCRKAIDLNPDLSDAHYNLGIALREEALMDEAIAAFRRAAVLKPNSLEASRALLLSLHLHPGYDAQAIAEEHRSWNRRQAEPLKKLIQPHANDRNPDRRLRIGYVSPDFREHVVGRFLLPLLSQHDKNQVEVFAYAQVPEPDATTERLRSSSDVWRNIVGISDASAAELIRQDQIDILVDLSMHAANNRLLVFARKPAPVQVTYLAYCSTTGLETMDYRLSDPYLDPPGGDESVYSERTIRLPKTYWCYHPSIATPEVGPLPAEMNGIITFGCLNNFCKVSEPALAAWANLLRGIANSQLLLHAKEGSHRQRLLDRLEREGIEPRRVRFAGEVQLPDYFQLHHGIDIALDPFPYGGGTTTCDALWMGVPVVSLAGKTAVGRGGLSLLSIVGLPELVGRSEEEYVRIATELATDLLRLAEIRRSLRGRMLSSPLMDAVEHTQAIESAYRRMWRDWCKGKA